MWEEGIELGQIGGVDDHVRRRGKWLWSGDQRQDRVDAQRLVGGQSHAEGVVDRVQAVVFRGVQELQILLDRRRLRRAAQQLIKGHAEAGRGVQMLDILVVQERAWLADQRIDDVAKVDRFLAAAELPGQAFDAGAAIPEFHVILLDAGLQTQADVLAAHRVGVAFQPNDAIGPDRHEVARAHAATLPRQGAKRGAFLAEWRLARGVSSSDELPHAGDVVLHGREVAAAAQPEGLIEPVLEVPVRRLDVAVLLRLADVDPMPVDAVVRQQIPVGDRELPPVRQVVDGRRQAVATNSTRHAAGQVQGVLQSGGERLERFRMAQMHVFPIRVGQHGMEHQVFEGPSLDRDAERVHVHEVEREHVARLMDLGKTHFLFDAVLQLPTQDPSLQRPPELIRDAWLLAGQIVLLLQPIQDRVRLQAVVVLE